MLALNRIVLAKSVLLALIVSVPAAKAFQPVGPNKILQPALSAVPLWELAEVEKGDTFWDYCRRFVTTVGIDGQRITVGGQRIVVSPNWCVSQLKVLNEGLNSDQDFNLIYPGEQYWLPSLTNDPLLVRSRLGGAAAIGLIHDIPAARKALGIPRLAARIEALETQVQEISGVANRIENNVESITQAIRSLVDRTEVVEGVSEGNRLRLDALSVNENWWLEDRWFWLITGLLALLGLTALLTALWAKQSSKRDEKEWSDHKVFVAGLARQTDQSRKDRDELAERMGRVESKLSAVDREISNPQNGLLVLGDTISAIYKRMTGVARDVEEAHGRVDELEDQLAIVQASKHKLPIIKLEEVASLEEWGDPLAGDRTPRPLAVRELAKQVGASDDQPAPFVYPVQLLDRQTNSLKVLHFACVALGLAKNGRERRVEIHYQDKEGKEERRVVQSGHLFRTVGSIVEAGGLPRSGSAAVA